MLSRSLKFLTLAILSLFVAATVAAQNMPAGDAAKVLADFPKDIPIYKNAKLSASGPWMGDPTLGKSYRFDTADALDAVQSFYKQQLPANGWAITKNSYVANPNTITVTKGSRTAMVSPNRVAGKGNVQVTRIEVILLATK